MAGFQGSRDRSDCDVSAQDFPNDDQSLRLRGVSSRMSNRNYPQFNWSSSKTEVDEESSSVPPRDLRAIPLPMALKRAVRQVQQMQIPVVSSVDSWKNKRNKTFVKLKTGAREVIGFFTLWRKSLQKIAGNFGGGVQSYFLFLRFLVVLNFVSFLLIAAFVIIPSAVFRSVESSPSNNTGPEKCLNYDPNPEGLVVFYYYFLHFLSGTGFIEYTYLFYGYYNNTLVEGINSYNISLAYLLTTAFYLLFCLFCIIARMGTTARVAVATGGSTEGNHSMVVFTGWDYGCCGDQATKQKQQNIYYQLQVDLEEEIRKKKAASLTQCQKIVLYSARILLFILSLGLTAAAFTGIFFATNFSQTNSKEGILGLIFQYLPSIVITAANFIVPLMNDQIAPFEQYSPSTTVILALFRAVFLRLASLGVLLFTLWSQITCDNNTSDKNCALCHYNVKAYQCWETRVGQEMYKLTLFDFLINLAVLFLVEFPRRLLVDYWPNRLTRWVGRQEFVVPYNVLGLVYGQTIVWTGAFFCPLLPLINTIKFVLLFYCKKITLFYNCRPALKTFRSTTSSFFFSGILLLGLSLATLVMIYSVAEIHPSMACGPFRLFQNMWEVVPTTVLRLSLTTRKFLFFIGSQAFSIPLFALSCVMLCYVIALATVYKKSVSLLRAQLKQEGRDKMFLVKQIERMSRL